jgi:cbb3-type cytochrome oxidase maturation protein
MESLAILVPLSVALVLLIGWVFWRAVEGGQFDDLEREGHSILADNDRPRDQQGSQSFDLNQETHRPDR